MSHKFWTVIPGLFPACCLTAVLSLTGTIAFGQNEGNEADTLRVAAAASEPVSAQMEEDTLIQVEDAPLDIAQNRGLFISTPDERLQLRILGSVRYLVVFDDLDLDSKQALYTVEIPTGDGDTWLPNYFNGLDLSRIGFEVTRKVDDQDLFIRLETDFAGQNGYRLRHAYGKYKSILLGQTWSLFAQVRLRPATVSTGGPTGSVSRRTPQIRYSSSRILPRADLALALEYSTPNVELADSISLSVFQVIPDLTARVNREYGWGSAQVSAIFPFLSGRQANGSLVVRPGWGLSVAARLDSWLNGSWTFHLAGGRAITRFFNDIGTQGLDLLIDPEERDAVLPFTWGGYLGYQHRWTDDLFAQLIYGHVQTERFDFQPENSFFHGQSLRFNTFWNVIEGARIGGEVIFARRSDKDRAHGNAFRVALLFYYDF